MSETISDLVSGHPAGAVAVAAPERPNLTYEGLRRQIDRTIEALNGFGLGRNDPIAIVLPNGPEMATAFVAVAAGAVAAPLNPAYRAEEFEFYLTDLGARALITLAGADTPARATAARHGIALLELRVPEGAPAGVFELRGSVSAGAPAHGGPATADDVALLLHTSGTTSRPKIVPLSQHNLAVSAASIRRAVALSPADRCLNVMPLFHIHGLMAAVLASFAAGATVVCTPGFNALRFFAWLDEFQPTWYTAVPTMHQAILARSARNPESVERARLRLIRSSSSSLPPQVMADLERTVPLPGDRVLRHDRGGSPDGKQPVAARGAQARHGRDRRRPRDRDHGRRGTAARAGGVGEVVIRGPSVTRGYQNNPTANAASFTDGWFHTGDQGVLDDEGYLTLTGRLKEIINRGGEKVAPLEVDNVLSAHPAVAQALTFAMPHAKLGEEVAAAIVLKEGQSASESEIRDFAAERLADFKVPRKLVFLDEIPKGATGKLQRIGLAERLGLGP